MCNEGPKEEEAKYWGKKFERNSTNQTQKFGGITRPGMTARNRTH
jgi:hypothetical protein